MAGKVYRMTQVVGTSDESVIDAIQGAVETAAETVRNLDWFEVGEIRGRVDDGKVAEYQVTLRIGFRYEN
ncbi:MAG: dodecin family protein [Rhodospirillales bacterium]|nr:dodecin family protein [Rhodospirillales bacterium]